MYPILYLHSFSSLGVSGPHSPSPLGYHTYLREIDRVFLGFNGLDRQFFRGHFRPDKVHKMRRDIDCKVFEGPN